MSDTRTVYVVIVDWGTMDGFRSRDRVWRVYDNLADALVEAEACRSRTPYPAYSAEVEGWAVLGHSDG